VALFVNIIAGLLGGYSGYRLFIRIKSTNIYKKIAMIVVSAILGFVFSSLNFICYLPQSL